MIIALQTLVYFRQSFLTIIQRFLSPYYRQLSLVLIGQENEEVEDEEDQVFADYDHERGVLFYPPVYAQRYAAVSDCLIDPRWAGKLQKVVDLGYHDLSFVKYLKDLPGVTYIMGVDIESISLRCSSELLGSDNYIHKKDTPLRVALFQGNAADPDYRLIGCDAVIAIEMIEHMLPHDLDRLVHNVFGFIKPWVAVFTTPNADFNVLFKNMEKNGLRRWDHLFEWTREQFHDWCSNIVSRYPQFTVMCKGIGPGPPGTQHLGCCSQMALFVNENYHKQKDLEPNSLALVAKMPSPQNIQDMIGWESPTGSPDRRISDTNNVPSPNVLLSEQSCITIIISPSNYTVEDLTYRDSMSQCNLDREFGKNYMMFDDEDSFQVLVPRRILDHKCYVMEDVLSRLNCSTFEVKKFSKPTQVIMAKNDVNALVHTRDVVKEIQYLTKMLNLNKTSLEDCKKNENIWCNINWGDNAPFWNNYYTVVREYNYPFEAKSDDCLILDLVSAEINRLIDSQYDEEFSVDVYKLEIPITHLMQVVRHITTDYDKVKELLDWNGYEVVGDTVVHSRMVVECPWQSTDTGSRDEEWNDGFSDWDNTDERSTTISDGSNLNNGKCLRRALDRKVRKLHSMMSADGDIAAELDSVVCRLMKLALWTCKGKQRPPPARWMQCKLFDLLALTEKSITRRKKYFLEQRFPMQALSDVVAYDDLSKYRDQNSVRLIESRYKELCFTPELSDNAMLQELVCNYEGSCNDVSIGGKYNGDRENISDTKLLNTEFSDMKRTHYWLEQDSTFGQLSYMNTITNDRSSSESIYFCDKSAKESKVGDKIKDYYGSTNVSATKIAKYRPSYIKLEEDKESKHKLHKTDRKRLELELKSSSSRSIRMSTRKRNTGGINDLLNSKRLDKRIKKHKKLQSTASKPIPGSIIELCHPELSTQHNKEGPKCFANHIQPIDHPDGNVSATEESVLIDIIMDDAEETIALRRTIATEADEDQKVLEQESLLASIVNAHENDFPDVPRNVHSQSICIYDIDEPSTSKGVRHTSMDVQCGPDDSTPAYVMLSPASSIARIPTLHETGIKIGESNSNLSANGNRFGTYNNANLGPVCQSMVSPNRYNKGIEIDDSETDVTRKPEDYSFDISTLTAIEEYEHGTVYIMPTFRKTEIMISDRNPRHESLEKQNNDMDSYNSKNYEDYEAVTEHDSKEEQKSRNSGLCVNDNEDKTKGAKPSDAYEHGLAQLIENVELECTASSCIIQEENKNPDTGLKETAESTVIDVALQEEYGNACRTEESCRSHSPILLSNTLDSSMETNFLNLLPNGMDMDDSGSDFCVSFSSHRSPFDLICKRDLSPFSLDSDSKQLSKKRKLICGGVHTHSYKDKQESEDIMYQGLWQKILTHVRTKPSTTASKNMAIGTNSVSTKKSNNFQNRNTKDVSIKKIAEIPTTSMTTLGIKKIKKNMTCRATLITPVKRNFLEINKLTHTNLRRRSTIPVINGPERKKNNTAFRRNSLSPTRVKKLNGKILTDMSFRRASINPTTVKSKLDAEKVTNMTVKEKSVSLTSKKDKTLEKPIQKGVINETRKKPMVEYPRLQKPKQEQVETELTKPKRTIINSAKRKKSCTKVTSKTPVSSMASIIKKTKSVPRKSGVTLSTKCPNSMPAVKTDAKAYAGAKESDEKLMNRKVKKSYIPSYLKRKKVLENQDSSICSFETATSVLNNVIIEDSSSIIKDELHIENKLRDTVKTDGHSTLNNELPDFLSFEEIEKTELIKEMFTMPDEVECIKKGITKFSTPTAARINKYNHLKNNRKHCINPNEVGRHNTCRENIETDLLKFNTEALDMSYLVFRNELDNNVKSSTNCSTTDNPRDNSKKKTGRKLPSSPLSHDSSCSSPDSVATVKLVHPRSPKRYSTSSNKSSMANSESEPTTPARNRKFTKRLKPKKLDKDLTDKENVPQSSKTSAKKNTGSDKNALTSRKKSVYLAMATETPIVDSLSVSQSQTATKSNIKKIPVNKVSDEIERPETVSPVKSSDSSFIHDIQNQDSTGSEISNMVLLIDSRLHEQYNCNETVNHQSQSSECNKPDSSVDVVKQSTANEVMSNHNQSSNNIVDCTLSSTMRNLIIDSLEVMKTSCSVTKPNIEEACIPKSCTGIVIPPESIVLDEVRESSSTHLMAQDSFFRRDSKTAEPEADINSFKSTSDYFLAENEFDIKSLTPNSSFAENEHINNNSLTSTYFLAENEIENTSRSEPRAAPAESDAPRANSVTDIFERKEPLMSATPASGLATQAFSGFSMNAEPVCGDQPDYVNLIDSETGSLAIDYHGRQTASEELFVSGRSSESYESCLIDEDSVLPNWLFEIIQQQQQQAAAAAFDEPPEFDGPMPMNGVDYEVNNNPVEPMVGVAAGAGDGRGIHSDHSQDSSGRGTSLSSSDTSSGQTSATIPTDSSAFAQFQLLREANGNPASVPTLSLPGDETVFTVRNVDSPGNDSEILSTSWNESRRNRHHLMFSDADADVSSLDTDVPDPDSS